MLSSNRLYEIFGDRNYTGRILFDHVNINISIFIGWDCCCWFVCRPFEAKDIYTSIMAWEVPNQIWIWIKYADLFLQHLIANLHLVFLACLHPHFDIDLELEKKNTQLWLWDYAYVFQFHLNLNDRKSKSKTNLCLCIHDASISKLQLHHNHNRSRNFTFTAGVS